MNATNVERSVAGFVLRDVKVLAEAIAMGLESRHFQDPFARAVYQAVIDTWLKNRAVDIATVASVVGFERMEDLKALRRSAPLTTNTATFIQEVLDQALCNALSERLGDLLSRLGARNSLEPITTFVEDIGSLLMLLRPNGPSGALATSLLEVSLRSVAAATDERVAKKTGTGIPSGFPRLDARTYGFQPGWMYVLGARTGVGKTTLATTMAVNAAKAGHRVAMFTVEMNDTDLATKILSRESRVPMSNIMLGDLNETQVDRLHDGASELQHLPLFICSVAKPQLQYLALEITRLVKVERVEFVIIDYLQQFETGEEHVRRMTARDTAKSVSVAIQSLAKQLGIPIMVLSQLNREAPEEGEPDLRHIAETDQIARDADVVFFLYRAEGRHFLSIAKQRRGQVGTTKLEAHLEISDFQQARVDGTR